MIIVVGTQINTGDMAAVGTDGKLCKYLLAFTHKPVLTAPIELRAGDFVKFDPAVGAVIEVMRDDNKIYYDKSKDVANDEDN